MRFVILCVMCALGFAGCGSGESYYKKAEEAYIMKEYAKAKKLLTKACKKGSATSCMSLGLMYEKGNHTELNLTKAIELYTKACDLGEAKGCNSVGAAYKNGKGVEQDYTKAKEFYAKSCKIGYKLGCDWYWHLKNQTH